MSKFAGFDLDRSSARAWSRFQARLADHLVEMGEDDIALVEVEVADDDLDGAAPYVQFVCFGDGTMLRAEVSSNAYLDEKYELDRAACDRLESLGWHAPTSGPGECGGESSANFFLDVEVTDGDRVAVMAVNALREVFGVAHPAFLIAEDLEGESDEEPVCAEPAAAAPQTDEPLATTAESSEHLQELVDAALTQMLGSPPEKDDDGDIPFPYGSSLLWVRVEESAPVVQLFSVVVEGVKDRDRAAYEVNVLNRDTRFLKFHLSGDRVIAALHLPAWPFVPEHLRSMLAGMSSKLDEIDDDLAARTGGRRALEPDEDSEEETCVDTSSVPVPSLDTTLTTLLHLDADPDASLDPELAAGVCRFDQELIVRLLAKTEDQELVWQRHREDALLAGELDEADACEKELVSWQRTTMLLRRALRLVVERSLGREPSGGTLYATPARTPRRRMPPRFRGSMSPRSPRSHRIHSSEELLALYDVEDLVALDEKLTECSGADVEVFDVDGYVEVQVEGEEGRLPYPFTSADFHALLEHLHDRAFEGAPE